MAFFTNVVDLQAALSACLTVRDWEMLTEAVQIPENFITLAYARLTELTLQEIEVSFIFHWLVIAFVDALYHNTVSSLIFDVSFPLAFEDFGSRFGFHMFCGLANQVSRSN